MKTAKPESTVRRSSVPGETDATYNLSVLEGADAPMSVTLDAASPSRVLIGTSPVCTMRLTDPQVSRRHASLALAGAHVQFLDLGSTNGTTINGVFVKEVSLRGGEAIRMGNSVLSLQRGGAKTCELGQATSFGRVIGESAAMRRLYPTLETLAAGTGPILIEGEAGTGKELVAEEIHRASKRANAPFLVLEASSLPSNELAARLFGADETGSLLGEARGGVLFIDEVGDLPKHVQARLVEALAPTDVMLIAATRRDLDRDVTANRFNDKLFFTLAGQRFELPPLRDRLEDVPLLAAHFWNELVPEGEAKELPVDLLSRFEHYPFPGNVRELRTIVSQRATFGELSQTFLSDHLGSQSLDLVTTVIEQGLPFPMARDRVVSDFERRYVTAILARHNGNVGAAARASGVAHRYFQLIRARVR